MNRQTLSNLKSLIYRKPKDELKRLSRWGVNAYFRCDHWATEMEESVAELPGPDFESALPPIEVWFLTGERFWFQTAYCAWTLSQHSRREVILNLVDDGTLSSEYQEKLRNLFPKGSFLSSSSVEKRLESQLPRHAFPVLRQRCDDYVNIRKLVDVHLGSRGWKLVLDSDMLFFSTPEALINWWDQSVITGEESTILLMRDCEESYGYSREAMSALTGKEIPRLLNVGVCGLKSEDIDWVELESWCATLSTKEGTSYFLEQALVAMMASRRPHTVLPHEDYVTFPTELETRRGSGVLQHYVADSKPWYFEHAWKIAGEANNPLKEIELPA
ncbi:MAG: hypothetical protein P1U58_14780 [Verrucomicrobiales bacterium]|nr:hypothetical protein [Verrucomicrobiales bacterium]